MTSKEGEPRRSAPATNETNHQMGELSRRDAIKLALAAAIPFGHQLSQSHRVLAQEAIVSTSQLVEMSPLSGQGIISMLRHFGFRHPGARGMFEDYNADILANGDGLERRKKYRLPLLLMQVQPGESLSALLARSGVPKKYFARIHVLNTHINVSYKNTVRNKNVIKSGQEVYVPLWGSGFYEGDNEIAEESVPRHRQVVQTSSPSKSGAIAEAEEDKELEQKPERAPVPDRAIPETIRVHADPSPESDGPGLTYAEMKAAYLTQTPESSELKNHCFILDPGHGGEDPGALPKTLDGDGKEIHVHEAAVVYDVSLRIMRALQKKSGLVYLTHASPTRKIFDAVSPPEMRDSNYELNGAPASQPISADNQRDSLNTRERIANTIAASEALSQGRKTVFFSIHADSLASRARLPLTVYVDRKRNGREGETAEQLAFAERLVAHFPNRGARSPAAHEKALGVLDQNKANIRMLIEIGNLANSSDSWLLRDPRNRENIAQTIVNAFVSTLDK